MREDKQQYSEKPQTQVTANDSAATVWRGLKKNTNYKPTAPDSMNDLHLANELNEFYCQFEKQWSRTDTSPTSAGTLLFHHSSYL